MSNEIVHFKNYGNNNGRDNDDRKSLSAKRPLMERASLRSRPMQWPHDVDLVSGPVLRVRIFFTFLPLDPVI